ncbi:haloacid dehalogenase superfamily, subfamily IA, variant 3 with third motif having DD or ED [Cryobacterium flavum]|uniref:HAD family phosphatase n=1 Tax=Cryobacterium flavum TaxID=1424659 RepID=A0A4R8VGU9_9MICO|nr:HAD family phosphatase [Cryobacterium flavum]TFB82373.1 HAD family phosphatase [Cryobacterium flavum]SDO49267.1 haloacid dehalogenase superfamily, subfamily IA, variant 3 with third motif having DD or ED [Cryobacterium flavum]
MTEQLVTPTVGWSMAEMQGILLDFNGTLSDDEDLLSDLIRELARDELGVQLSADRYTAVCAGLSDRAIVTLLAAESTRPHASVDELLTELTGRYQREAARVQLISQPARDFVRQAAGLGLALAVVTGAGRQSVLPALRNAGLHELLGTVVAEEDVAAGKPDPEGFLRGAELLGLSAPRQIVVLEDSLPGIAAARAAGMRVLAIAGTHSASELASRCDGVLESLSPSALTRRFGSAAENAVARWSATAR